MKVSGTLIYNCLARAMKLTQLSLPEFIAATMLGPGRNVRQQRANYCPH
jgi:hypothetical protein